MEVRPVMSVFLGGQIASLKRSENGSRTNNLNLKQTSGRENLFWNHISNAKHQSNELKVINDPKKVFLKRTLVYLSKPHQRDQSRVVLNI